MDLRSLTGSEMFGSKQRQHTLIMSCLTLDPVPWFSAFEFVPVSF